MKTGGGACLAPQKHQEGRVGVGTEIPRPVRIRGLVVCRGRESGASNFAALESICNPAKTCATGEGVACRQQAGVGGFCGSNRSLAAAVTDGRKDANARSRKCGHRPKVPSWPPSRHPARSSISPKARGSARPRGDGPGSRRGVPRTGGGSRRRSARAPEIPDGWRRR